MSFAVRTCCTIVDYRIKETLKLKRKICIIKNRCRACESILRARVSYVDKKGKKERKQKNIKERIILVLRPDTIGYRSRYNFIEFSNFRCCRRKRGKHVPYAKALLQVTNNKHRDHFRLLAASEYPRSPKLYQFQSSEMTLDPT